MNISDTESSYETLLQSDHSLNSSLNRRFTFMLVWSVILHLGVWLSLQNGTGRFNRNQIPIINVSIEQIASPPAEQTLPSEETTSEEIEDSPPDAAIENAVESLPPTAVRTITPEDTKPSSLLFSISSGSFASFGDGISLRDDIRPYFLDMLERINTSWKMESNGTQLKRAAMLLVSLEKDGIVKNVNILKSSGNNFHDRMLVSAISKTVFLPLPSTYSAATFDAPVRFSPPLSLMQFGNSAPDNIPVH